MVLRITWRVFREMPKPEERRPDRTQIKDKENQTNRKQRPHVGAWTIQVAIAV